MTEAAVDTSLQYKDHREFFEKYFEIRFLLTRGLAEASFSGEKLHMQNLYKDLVCLVDWSNNYIFDEKIDKRLETLQSEIFKIPRGNPNPMHASKIIKMFRVILKIINNDHERAEILPKKLLEMEDEERKYYREEKDPPTKYAKKAFTDMILKKF